MLPRTMVARLALDRHAAPFSRPVIVVALLLAVFQAAGVTAALMSASDLVPQTDKAIQIAMTASLTGGVALMMALARLIDERGMGGGFWIFMAAGPLLTLPSNAAGLFANFEQGLIGPERLVFTILSMVGIFAVVVFVLRARWRAKLPRLEPVIWPLFLAGLAMSLALDAVILLMLPFSSINSLDLPIAILASEPVSSIIFVVAGCLFAARYARLEKSGILWLPSMLLVLLAVLPSAFRSLSGGEILLAGTDAIVVAAVAYSIIQTTQLSPH